MQSARRQRAGLAPHLARPAPRPAPMSSTKRKSTGAPPAGQRSIAAFFGRPAPKPEVWGGGRGLEPPRDGVAAVSRAAGREEGGGDAPGARGPASPIQATIARPQEPAAKPPPPPAPQAETEADIARPPPAKKARAARPARPARRAVVDSDDDDAPAAAAASSDDGSSSASEFVAGDEAGASSESDDSSLAASSSDEGEADPDEAPSPVKPSPVKRGGAAGRGRGGGRGAATPAPRTAPPPTPATPFTPAASSMTAPPSSGGGGADVARFAARAAERFPFLAPAALRDAAGRAPDNPDYNPRTLRIPPGWFKAAKVTEAQRQWWELKAKNFDSVLFFKMGKFYELFEMDAHTGADVLGLQYMRGDQPHCGFPEASYAPHAAALARAGRRVVVVEQTETPAGLAAHNELRKKQGLPKAAVVSRGVVAVLTAGTLVDPDMVDASPDATIVLALCQAPSDDPSQLILGAAAIDAAAGRVAVGGWADGPGAPRLRALLAELRPVELVLPPAGDEGCLGAEAAAALRAAAAGAAGEHWLPRGGDAGAWDAIGAATAASARWGAAPALLERLAAARPASPTAAAALAALGGAAAFLGDCLLDRAVLASPASLVPLPGCCEGSEEGSEAGAAAATNLTPLPTTVVSIDGPALDALEVLVNTTGGSAGTLLSALDFCVTPGGRRLLRGWLCRPLGAAAAIVRRQDAVAALLDGAGRGEADAARAALARVGDLERALARLVALATAGGAGRDADGVVLYEDAAKRRVTAVATALGGVRAVLSTLAAIRALPAGDAGGESGLLRELTGDPALAPGEAALAELEAAADWRSAVATGRLAPAPGADPAVDAATAALRDADRALADHEAGERAALGCRSAALVSVGKETHLLEVPAPTPVPPFYDLVSQRKGFKRYASPELRRLVGERARAVADRDAAAGGVLKGLLARVAAAAPAWAAAVAAACTLDALLSLAAAAEAGAASGPMCRPTVVDAPASDPQSLRASALRHPAADALLASAAAGAAAFVPNDVALGGAAPPFVLLTGPNMGGKSTLLRQVCLAALAAHVGAWVPASSFALTTVDAIFVRMGAKDALLAGQSTFAVELQEVAAPLARGTPRSLVALDELGRGTATGDGAAIAGAVLAKLAGDVRCRGLFATHYHALADEAATTRTAAVMHMAADVGGAVAPGRERVTFLYKLTPGACPRSYGTNVARLAGVPDAVVDRAAALAAGLEAGAGLAVAGGVPRAVAAAVRAVAAAAAAGDAAALKAAAAAVV